MFDVQIHFYSYLEIRAASYYNSSESWKIETDISRLASSPHSPYKFFKWFFAFEITKPLKPHPFFIGGQKLFIEFFNELHLQFMIGIDSVKEHRMINETVHYIEYYDHNEEFKSPILHKKEFHFEKLLEELLESEYRQFEAQLIDNIQYSRDIQNLHTNLTFAYNNVNKLIHLTIALPTFNSILNEKFEKYKEKIMRFIAFRIPVLNKESDEILKNAVEVKRKVHAFCNNLKLENRHLIDVRKTNEDDIVNLLLKKDYTKKVYFNCDEQVLAYVFDKLREFVKPKPNKKLLCENQCLWFLDKDEYIQVTSPGNYETAKSRIPNIKKQKLDKFFNSL